MKVVVLAAGKGVRLKPLTGSKPKAMVELLGKPLLQWNLEAFRGCRATEIALIVGYLREQVQEFFKTEFYGIPITYIEQKERLGTGHAFALAKGFCGKENFLAGYCDVIFLGAFIHDFFVFAEKNSERFDAVMAVRKVEDASRFGTVETEKNIVKSLVEKPKEKKPGFINAGLYWFSPKIFGAIKKTKKSARGEIEITDSIKEFIPKKRLGCFEVQGTCLDIGTIEELNQAKKQLLEAPD